MLNETLKDVMRVPAKSLWPVDQRTWGEAVHFMRAKMAQATRQRGDLLNSFAMEEPSM